MERIDLRPLIKEVRKAVDTHELPDMKGAYSRWLWQDENGTRELGINEYGCADAMNILYTINDFYCDEETRKARIDALKSLQDKETGMFHEVTHHTIHTTAHCTAALQLFDEKPLYPIKGLHKYLNKDELYALLDGLRWEAAPWRDSHEGAGVYAALVNADEATEDFCKAYFEWFWENADEITGFWKKGYAQNAPFSSERSVDGKGSLYTVMAGGFHYMFNHEYAKMPYRYPEKMVDTCISLYKENKIGDNFSQRCNFIEVDWVYATTRALRQTAHRRDEAMALIEDFAVKYIEFLMSIDHQKHDGFNDLHCLFGVVCALAELSSALPGKFITEKPLRLVLDRRPFI